MDEIYIFNINEIMFFKKNKDKTEQTKNEHNAHKILVARINKDNKPHNGKKNILNLNDHVIEFDKVQKSFVNDLIINPVLKSISLKVKKGDFIVILGKSGSGKTTLMNIMSGLIRATNGKTVVSGKDLINLSDSELTEFRRKKIGYIFQEYGLLETLTVYENVKIGYKISKNTTHTDDSKDYINDLLKSVNLYEHRKKFPYELSGGQQQRVAICRALAKNPEIIFADEPTGALDIEMSILILNLLKKVNTEIKTTIIIITHDKEIAKLANHVYVIKDGIIDDSYKNVNPQNPLNLYKDL
ncbi:MAG: ABC transporter ATP-binding protein [Malacoplasma sp.]